MERCNTANKLVAKTEVRDGMPSSYDRSEVLWKIWKECMKSF